MCRLFLSIKAAVHLLVGDNFRWHNLSTIRTTILRKKPPIGLSTSALRNAPRNGTGNHRERSSCVKLER